MSEDKNNIIKSVYNAKDGFGSVATTFTKAKEKDNTITKTKCEGLVLEIC